MRKKTKCLIFNDRYSENLGDGVIAECLERCLSPLCSAHVLATVDIDAQGLCRCPR